MRPINSPHRPYDEPVAKSRRRYRYRPNLEWCEGRILLTTYTVSALTDAGTGRGTVGDLRYCIRQANADGRQDTITFAVTGTIQLGSALPPLVNARGITIVGPGAGSMTVRGGGASSRFTMLWVKGGTTAAISGVTFENGSSPRSGGAIFNGGKLRITDAAFAGNSARWNGGAINNVGTLRVVDSSIDGNSAGRSGGAINNSGTLRIAGSTIVGNSADNAGGGIDTTIGTLEITGTTLAGNSAGVFGGGISLNGPTDFGIRGGKLTLLDSTLSDNTAGRTPDRGYGGGIGSNESEAEIRGTSFTGNTSGRGAGGVGINGGELSVRDSAFGGNTTGGDGGGISINGGTSITGGPKTQGATLSVARSTFVGNSARGDGGGIESISTTAKITDATFGANTADGDGGGISLDSDPTFNETHGLLTLSDSTLSGNTAGRDGGAISNRDHLNLINVTVTGNQAGENGGGIHGRQSLMIRRSNITENRPDNINGND